MANVLGIVWIVIGYAAMNACLLIWAALMLPRPVERARQRLERQPVASFFTGLLFALATVFVAGSLVTHGKPGGVQLLGWMLAGPTFAAAVIGSAAFARILAARVVPEMKSGSGFVALLAGALCTTLAGLLPVVGWFVFLPLVLLTSIGAGMLGWISKREVAATEAWQPQAPGYGPGYAPQGEPSWPAGQAPAYGNPQAAAILPAPVPGNPGTPAQPDFIYESAAPSARREAAPSGEAAGSQLLTSH